MHTLLTSLRAHNFNLSAAAAELADDQLLTAAADATLLAHLESLLNLSRLCLALQAAAARQSLLASLHVATPGTPAEQRRLANTLTRATDVRLLTPKPGNSGLRHVPATPHPAEDSSPPVPTHASMPPALMPSPPSSTPIPPPRRRLAHSPAARLLAAAALPPRAPDTG